MLRLNLLGAIHLVDAEGRQRNADAGGNKNLALLAYLVMEGAHGPVRRDKVVSLFWPDADQKNARQSLSQALYKLRNEFPQLVESQGHEELLIDADAVDCDCFEFARLARDGELEAAVGLYRGDFADGLHLKESVEFDEWLSNERTAWRAHLKRVVCELFRAAVDAKDFPAAASWCEKLLQIAPDDDSAVRTLLPLLVDHQPTLAIRVYDRYRTTLREQFEVDPAPDVTAIVEGIPKSQLDDVVKRTPFYIGEASRAPHRLARMSLIGAFVVIVMLMFGFWYVKFPTRPATASLIPATRPRVAVMQFGYSGAAQRSASVLNDALQWRLHDVGFEVIDAGRQDTAVIRRMVSATDGMTFIIGGDVEPLADASLVARLWLQDAVSGKRIWTSEFSEKAPDAHVIATQLSEAVATQVRKAAGLAVDLGTSIADVPEEAWSDVYHARERMEAALDMQQNGSNAGANTELTEAEATLIDLTRRYPDWQLPWILRARIAEGRGSSALIAGDPRAGSNELERGIRLLDSVARRTASADLYETRGKLQYRRWLFGIDDVGEAATILARSEKDLREALRLGHERSDSYVTLSGVMSAEGKYVEAFVYARRAYDSNVFLRHNQEILNRLFNSALHSGDDQAANQWCNELRTLDPGAWPGVMCRIHLAGFAPQLVPLKGLQAEIENVKAPPAFRAAMQPRMKAAYAISLAQLGMKDSARATLRGVAGNEADTELSFLEACAYAALNDAPQAHALLRKYLAQYRGTRSAALSMRWLRQSQTQVHDLITSM